METVDQHRALGPHNGRFLRHRFSPKLTNVATPISLPKRNHVAKEAVSAAWQTKTRFRSSQTLQTERFSKDEAAALRKNHVVGHGPSRFGFVPVIAAPNALASMWRFKNAAAFVATSDCQCATVFIPDSVRSTVAKYSKAIPQFMRNCGIIGRECGLNDGKHLVAPFAVSHRAHFVTE